MASAIDNVFHKFSAKMAHLCGSPWGFILATVSIVIWAGMGPTTGFSDTWQLVMNTFTTIVTFLMVFLIQNTQNRDSKAIHLKLDELIRSGSDARNNLIDLEDMSEEELEKLQKEFERMRDGESSRTSKESIEEAREASRTPAL